MSTITISLSDGRLNELRALSNRSDLTVEEFVHSVLDEILIRSKNDVNEFDYSNPNAYPLPTLTPKGVSGSTLMKFVGTIPEDDLTIMREAIKECRQIDWDAW